MTRLPVPLKGELLKYKQAVFTIIIFHLMGLAGLCIPLTRSLFLQLVPFHLLLMATLIALNHNRFDGRFIFFGLTVYLLGFFAEWTGVQMHWLFGDYHYGKTLGWQLFNIPLIIGLNWFLLTYSTGVLMQRSRLRSPVVRIISGGLLLVLLDLLIEQLAVRFDYWHWVNGIIPLKNYLSWFSVSISMLTLFELFRFKQQSVVPAILLITQFIFFEVLYLVQVIFLP